MMTNVFDDLEILHPERENWEVLVKVIRLWYGQSFNNSRLPSSLELVVIDGKRTKIHVYIKKQLMYKFERVVSDGQVFSVACFEVVENSGAFKPTRHDYKINLKLKSEVRPMNQFPITVDPFSFVSLADVVAPNFDTSYLIDVVGILTGVGTEREIVTNGKKVMMNVIEIDSAGVKMEYALFGSYNQQLNIFLRAGDMLNVVILLQWVKVKFFQGAYSLQNFHGTTKILFNPAVPISESVRKSFMEVNEPGSQSLSQIQDSSKSNGDEEFLVLTPRKTLAELNEYKDNGLFIICGTVSYVEQGHDWLYSACKCNKKVYPDEKMYFCEVCNRHVVTVFPRFRLQLMVCDDTGSGSVLLFDKEATPLIGKTCAELLEMTGNSNGLPPDIEALCDKKFLFKVEVKNSGTSKFEACRYGPSYKVKRVCSDPAVIEKFTSAKLENSVGITSSRLLTTPSNVVNDSQVAKDLLDDFVVVSSEKTPATPEFVSIDLNDCTQDILLSKRATSPVDNPGNSCNMKKKKFPAKLKK